MAVKSKLKIALITGGTGGIGRFVVEKFLRRDYTVVLLEHSKKHFSAFPDCEGYAVDVSKPVAVRKVIGKILAKHGRIDVVVNIAGIIGPMGEFHKQSLKDWHKVMEVNLLGTANVCHAVLPAMVKQRSGKIINFSGGGAVRSFPNFSGYAASKAAVVRLTEILADEYAKYNIQINAVSPGLIITKMIDEQIKVGPKIIGRKYFGRVLKAKKNGGDSPTKAAELVLFLASPQTKLTGKVISAVYDDWRKFNDQKLNQSPLYTLRRIDNKEFFKKI